MNSRHELPLVYSGDVETGEIYIAQLVDDQKRGHGEETLPLVRILRVAEYPRQHAIQDHEVAMEFPPLEEGLVLRMAVFWALTPEEAEAARADTYKRSLREAQKRALKTAANEKEREIIRRHLDGVYRRKRLVRAYAPWEVKILLGK